MIGAHKAINYVSQLRSNQIELLIKKTCIKFMYIWVFKSCSVYSDESFFFVSILRRKFEPLAFNSDYYLTK